ncbi:MAG: nucleotidyltransferase [Chloroflexi bacterium]|nr:nucleotidyltransferase [Chloroflexota bacterium]
MLTANRGNNMKPALLPCEFDVHGRAMQLLNDAEIPYVVAGAYAMYQYTGIWRFTKDLDLFLVPNNVQRAMDLLKHAGYHTKFEAKHWLAKAIMGDCWVDIIYGFGNWMAPIDEIWIERSSAARILDIPVRVAPLEEVLWMKAYVAHWERYDLADVLHLIQAVRGQLDWAHLVSRFGDHFDVLLYYLTLFTYVYPADRDYIPGWVLTHLLTRLEERQKQAPMADRLCWGGLLDRYQYLGDIEEQAYKDVRERFAVQQGYTVEGVKKDRQAAEKLLRAGRVRARPF